MSRRDPFPPSKLENDFTLSGFRPLQRRSWSIPTHKAQMEEPWSRLYNTPTFASIQRSVLCPPQAPCDSLDSKLESSYDRHKDLYCLKYQFLCQKDAENQRVLNKGYSQDNEDSYRKSLVLQPVATINSTTL